VHLRLSRDQIGRMYVLVDLNEVLFLEPIRLMDENLSKREKPKFSQDGYLYVCDKCSRSGQSLLFWRCELKNECKGRVHTKNNEAAKKVNEHCHCASAVDVGVACIKTCLKRKAEGTPEAPSTIINGCIEIVLKLRKDHFLTHMPLKNRTKKAQSNQV